MEALLGTTVEVFIGVTIVLMGGAAFMTGQAIAGTWRPLWQVFAYSFLLALGSRFLIFALFQGQLLSATGFLADVVILTAIGLIAYRLTHVSKMLAQYPWLYQRQGLWSFREKTPFG
jgi:hypothetical protein